MCHISFFIEYSGEEEEVGWNFFKWARRNREEWFWICKVLWSKKKKKIHFEKNVDDKDCGHCKTEKNDSKFAKFFEVKKKVLLVLCSCLFCSCLAGCNFCHNNVEMAVVYVNQIMVKEYVTLLQWNSHNLSVLSL